MKAYFSSIIRLLGGILFVFLLSGSMNSQTSVAVTAGTPVPSGVLLEATSTTQGILLPRLNEGQKLTLSNPGSPNYPPAVGLMIYQTTGAKGYYHWDGTNWMPFSKNASGSVEMQVGVSNVLDGVGYTVSHLSPGLDEVFFDTPYSSIPVITTSGSTIVGEPPVYPNDFCGLQLANCPSCFITYINLQYPIVANNALNHVFQTGTTNCNPSPGNSTDYLLTDPEWLGGPLTFSIGQSFKIIYRTTSNAPAAITAWVDWNQSGFFELGEILQQEGAAAMFPNSASTLEKNFVVTVPAGACSGKTALRMVVRDQQLHNFACDLDPIDIGETENIELDIVGAACVYPERQTVCNVSAVGFTKFNVQCADLNGTPTNTLYHFKIHETF